MEVGDWKLRRLGQAAGFAQDEFDLVDDVGGLGRVRFVAFVDGAIADVYQGVKRTDAEESQFEAQSLLEVLVGVAGSVGAHQFTQGEFVEGLPAADLFLGLDEFLLACRRGLAEQLVVQFDQQVFQGARGGLHGLGVVLLGQQSLGFGQGLNVVHQSNLDWNIWSLAADSRSQFAQHVAPLAIQNQFAYFGRFDSTRQVVIVQGQVNHAVRVRGA